jgi:hypothetical protein
MCIFNLAHRGQRPKKDMPAFRFLGLRGTREEIQSHVQNHVEPTMKDCAIHMAQARKWVLICKTFERQQDGHYVMEKLEKMLQIYLQDDERRKKEFETVVQNQERTKQGQSLYKKREKARKFGRHGKINSRLKALHQHDQQVEHQLAHNDQIRTVSDVHRDALLRKQEYIVASVLPDYTPEVLNGTEDPEPAVCFWRAFPDYDSAHEWVTTVGARYVRKFPLDIYDAYEWIFPENVNLDEINEGYRHPEQNNMMNQKKREKARVMEFEQWCKDENQQVPVTEVVGNEDNKQVEDLRPTARATFQVSDTSSGGGGGTSSAEDVLKSTLWKPVDAESVTTLRVEKSVEEKEDAVKQDSAVHAPLEESLNLSFK